MERSGEAFDAGLEVPPIGVLDEFEQIVEFFFRPLACLVAPQGFDQIGRARLDVREHGGSWIEFEFLGQVAHTQTPAARDFAGVSFIFPSEDFEEARLAAAIATDERDFFTGGDGQSDAIKKKLRAIGETDFVGRKKGSRHQRR